MTNTLTGKTALVTGATAGIGYAIAVQLAAEGAEVVVHGRNAERGAKTVQDIENAGGKARFVAADVSSRRDVRRLADEAGDVDILVNNAGIYRFAPTFDTTDADFDDQINTNLKAPYVLVQKLVPGMIARGGGTVSTSPRSPRRPRPQVPASTARARRPGIADQAVGRRVRRRRACGSTPSPPGRRRRWAPPHSSRDLIEGLGRTHRTQPHGRGRRDRQRRDVRRLPGRELRQRRDPDRRWRWAGAAPGRLTPVANPASRGD